MVLEDCAFGLREHGKVGVSTGWCQLVRIQVDHPNVIGKTKGEKPSRRLNSVNINQSSNCLPEVLLVHQKCRGNANDESRGRMKSVRNAATRDKSHNPSKLTALGPKAIAQRSCGGRKDFEKMKINYPSDFELLWLLTSCRSVAMESPETCTRADRSSLRAPWRSSTKHSSPDSGTELCFPAQWASTPSDTSRHLIESEKVHVMNVYSSKEPSKGSSHSPSNSKGKWSGKSTSENLVWSGRAKTRGAWTVGLKTSIWGEEKSWPS